MKNRKMICLFCCVLLTSIALTFNSAQAQDTLTLKGLVEIEAINANSKRVSFQELIEAAQREGLTDAENHFRKARTFNVIGAVFGYPGSFLTGWGIGEFLFSGQIRNPGVFYAGLGMWGFNIILAATVRDPQLRKGVRIYNKSMQQKCMNTLTEDNP
jgi:hypothetical protein